LPLLDGQVHHDTHAIPMGNYVIGVGNYVIVSPSELGNYMIADRRIAFQDPGRVGEGVAGAFPVAAQGLAHEPTPDGWCRNHEGSPFDLILFW
jgi:hypothetical protein